MNLSEYTRLLANTTEEFAETELDAGQFFVWAIKKQNETYDLPVNTQPTMKAEDLGEAPLKRMQGFMKTLQKEMDEGKEIVFAMEQLEQARLTNKVDLESVLHAAKSHNLDHKRSELLAKEIHSAFEKGGVDEIERSILVMLADWFTDMSVYNRSEAMKYGLPIESVQTVVMASNFTKLGEDGLPIKDENGKFLKGPNFIAPEPHIYATLFEQESLLDEEAQLQYTAEAVNAAAQLTLMNQSLEELNPEVVDDGDYSDDWE